MKKVVRVLLALTMLVVTVACTSTDTSESSGENSTSTLKENGTYSATGQGYNGELTVDVVFEDGKIMDIVLAQDVESVPVITRAFPVLKERILEAQTPVVDTVTSATFSSYAIKSAVAAAAKDYGLDFGEITMSTQGPQVEIVEKDAITTDLVIVGGGPAGLSAAIEAKENGVENIILIEKLDILSGNGKFDMNFFDIVNTEAQKANGIVDSADDFYKDKVDSSMDSEKRVRVWADGAAEVDAWLRDLGVELEYNYGGRNHMAKEDEYAGNYIQDGLEAKVSNLNIDVRTGTKGVEIISDEDGTVLGISVESKTEKYDILADAVIIATGGFSYNKELIKKYIPGAEIINTSNSIGAQGDFVPVFEEKGYMLDEMDTLSIFKMINFSNRELTGAGDGFILVNGKGERFVDESSSGLDYAYALLEQDAVYYIYDQRLQQSMYRLKKHNDLGYHTKADSVEELAEKLGIPAEALLTSLETYNEAIASDTDDPFRKDNKFSTEFDLTGPVYGVRIEPAIHMTKGGVVANENAQVLDSNGEVVTNLFAAGEVTATQGAYAAAVIWGREAGANAAELINNK